ncbi:unnamed protein product [Discula destructiva]
MSGSGPSSRPHGDAGHASDSQPSGNLPHQTRVSEATPPRTEQELAQAFRELARGEQTAAALEANLTSLESKLDKLLASFETPAADAATPVSNGDSKGGLNGKAQADHNKDE